MVFIRLSIKYLCYKGIKNYCSAKLFLFFSKQINNLSKQNKLLMCGSKYYLCLGRELDDLV